MSDVLSVVVVPALVAIASLAFGFLVTSCQQFCFRECEQMAGKSKSKGKKIIVPRDRVASGPQREFRERQRMNTVVRYENVSGPVVARDGTLTVPHAFFRKSKGVGDGTS